MFIMHKYMSLLFLVSYTYSYEAKKMSNNRNVLLILIIGNTYKYRKRSYTKAIKRSIPNSCRVVIQYASYLSCLRKHKENEKKYYHYNVFLRT